MSILCLTLVCLAAVLAALTCFRVPSQSVVRRRAWALVQLVLLGSAALSGYLLLQLPEESAGGGPAGAAAVTVAGCLAAACGGAPVTTSILEISRRAGRRPLGEQGAGVPEPSDPERESTLHGGLWIGILERLAIVVCLLLGWPTGLTVVAAIKALGRFSELKDADAVERFILGTLASTLWAAAWAGVTLLLLA